MGLLDDIFRDTVAPLLYDLFIDKTVEYTRRTVVYNSTTDVEVETITVGDVKITPPEPYEIKEIDGSSILSGDKKTFVQATQMEDASLWTVNGSPATTGPGEPSPDYDHLADHQGVVWKVQGFEPIENDLGILYELQLRKGV